ncbi:MAG TPA: hypothetical protein PLY16_01500, partial [Candidatus Saccharibacteria bacterium]|nr:hypothetical protein [Candidatus Saccharibacteria bacterium]
DMRALYEIAKDTDVSYQALSKFPSTERDICFQVSTKTVYADVFAVLKKELAHEEFTISLEPVDIYQAKDAKVKNITLRAVIGSHQRTLTHNEVNTFFDNATKKAASRLNATIV